MSLPRNVPENKLIHHAALYVSRNFGLPAKIYRVHIVTGHQQLVKEMMPTLTKVAGFEWGTGIYINPTPPEEAARFLREASTP